MKQYAVYRALVTVLSFSVQGRSQLRDDTVLLLFVSLVPPLPLPTPTASAGVGVVLYFKSMFIISHVCLPMVMINTDP